MKFQCKNVDYHANNNSGIFTNAYIQDLQKTVEYNNLLIISYVIMYVINGVSKKSNLTGYLNFTTEHNEMYMLDENNEIIELTDFLSKGGVYSKDKVSNWGRPNAETAKKYFIPQGIYDELEFADTPYKEIAKDWVEHNLVVDNLPIVENFQYQED